MILKRSVLYVKPKGKPYRFIGWAVVTTTIGSMMEPFNISDKYAIGDDQNNFDYSDPMVRIDDLQNVDGLAEWKATSHGETRPIHGGDLSARVLIKDGNF